MKPEAPVTVTCEEEMEMERQTRSEAQRKGGGGGLVCAWHNRETDFSGRCKLVQARLQYLQSHYELCCTEVNEQAKVMGKQGMSLDLGELHSCQDLDRGLHKIPSPRLRCVCQCCDARDGGTVDSAPTW